MSKYSSKTPTGTHILGSSNIINESSFVLLKAGNGSNGVTEDHNIFFFLQKETKNQWKKEILVNVQKLDVKLENEQKFIVKVEKSLVVLKFSVKNILRYYEKYGYNENLLRRITLLKLDELRSKIVRESI